jgi:hypothetical protein
MRNRLAGSQPGSKSPVFRHTSHFFLTAALPRPEKNRLDRQKRRLLERRRKQLNGYHFISQISSLC